METSALLLSPRARTAWRATQFLVWLVGVAILAALFAWPDVGIHAFWNVLIPVAPALLVFAPGLWRNICPLASTALFARHNKMSARRKVSPLWQGRMLLIGVVVLFAVVPLRHVVLDTSGPATALAIIALAVFAAALGATFEWKSGWCSGACPVHAVERLYGASPAISPPNAHCGECHRCVQPCPDSTPQFTPLSTKNGMARRIAGLIMVGAFPGFIWGWFQVPDYFGSEGWNHLAFAYGAPLAAAAATMALFLTAQRFTPAERQDALVRTFACASVACYYWYRLPMLFGFGPHPGDGMLVDLSATLPGWFPLASRLLTTAVFAWWLVLRTSAKNSWALRPAFAG
ncbi:MAG: ferredoxin [Planctomycetota bacterium]|jgi:hypothetical protein